jgi:hypothetical protein
VLTNGVGQLSQLLRIDAVARLAWIPLDTVDRHLAHHPCARALAPWNQGI